MKSFFASAAALLSTTAAVVAQTTTQSAPFYLTLLSSNSTLNGTELGTCHEGAAIESLCIYADDVYTFQLNTTGSSSDVGALTWNLGGYESEGLSFQFQLSTNVAHPLFEPSEGAQSIGFDATERMFVSAYYNDEVTPPTYASEFELYDWYICETNNAGYVYQTLDFVVGNNHGTPTNPTCQNVDVYRTWA